MKYYRLTFLQATEDGRGKRRTAWVQQVNPKLYWIVNQEGERASEMLILDSKDIIKKVPAKMNLKYGELEV